ncbi:MAG: sigma-70 family RNA polymerase sigma factor [Acidobacteria bacterium]|nr:sigma-70 family RNA polymerase sigma factor [Acidobacteriota bacterium]
MVVPGADQSDEALAALAASGDGRAFELLMERYQSRIYRLACRMTSETEAPDVLQDTFLQVYRHLEQFRGASRFGTWLYRIATNVCLMRRRAASRRPGESLESFLPRFDESGRHEDTPETLSRMSHLDERIDRERLAERAHVALDLLPESYREAFVLRDLEELPTAEVAEALGLEPAAVRQRVHRARLMLRGYLNDLAGRLP